MPLRHGDLANLPLVVYVIAAAAIVLVVVGTWRVFVKAGKPGWAALIPIYSLTVLSEIARSRNGLLFTTFGVARAFGRGRGFGVGLAFLPFVFYPILGFGPARYLEPVETNRWEPPGRS
jgi:hypothetical protein